MSDVTHILEAVKQGDTQATDKLLPLVYEELRRLAACKLHHEPAGQTIQATALVHKAYVRLMGDECKCRLPVSSLRGDTEIGMRAVCVTVRSQRVPEREMTDK